MKKWLLVLVVAMLPARWVVAQPLADKVPSDALLYVAWAGTENLGPAYDQSHLKAVLDASGVPALFTDFLPRLSQRVSSHSPEASEFTTFLAAVGGRVLKHPCALYWGGIDFSNIRNPVPKVALICDAGGDAAELAKNLQSAIDKVGKPPVPIKATNTADNLVLLTIGPVNVPASAQKALGNDALFKEVMSKLHEKPVLAAFFDPAGVVRLMDNAPVRGKRAQAEHEQWAKIRDALHLGDAKALAWTSAFDGKDWSTRAFLAAPSPRAGIWSAMDVKPIGDEILKLVPETATMAAAGSFDPAKLLSGVRSTAGKVDPSTTAKIDQALDRFRTITGLDLQKDVLEPLGHQWVVYSDPSIAGSYSFSCCLINKLDDPAKTEASLQQLGRAATNFVSGQMAQSQMALTMQDVTVGDLKIHYLASPLVRPAWAIKDGVLYVAAYPQIVASAAAATPKQGGKTILDNASFAAMRKRLAGEQQPTSIEFIDLPKTAPTMYATWLVVSGYAGFGDLFGVKTPAMLLPPLDQLMPHLAPAGAVSWVDDAGWHQTSMSAFPGSTILASDPTTLMGPAVMTSILLPSLNRARETANRVKCASNERQIGMAILLYSNEHQGAYPPDLGTLIKSEDITVDVFACPSSDNDVPAEIKAANKEGQAAWINAHSSYVYVGQGLKNTAGADVVVLYEKNDNHDEDGMNILYGDGHIEWQSMEIAEQLIKHATEKK